MPYRNAQQQRAYQREWVQARRLAWIESKGGSCAECGSTELLEVDHIVPSMKAMNPREIWGRNETARNAELAKCQVLCQACHRAKNSRQFLTRQHGTNTMYNKGNCRCAPCRAAHAATRKARRARVTGDQRT